MSKPTLYYTAGSPPARAVLFLMRYLDIDVEVKNVNLVNREQYTEDFLKINPAHEVPVLVDGDFVLTESRAILAYLVNSRKPGSDLYPSDTKARARVDQRLSYDHILFTNNGILMRPILLTGATSTTQAARDAVINTLRIIDTFLSNSKWIAGETLTIADFSAAPLVATIVECGYDLTQHSNLNRWYTQCQSLNGFEENLQGAKLLATIIMSKVETVF